MPPRDFYALGSAYQYQAPLPQQYGRGQRLTGDLWAEVGTLGNVTIRGGANILEGGFLASGQSGYDQGTGFFFGSNDGSPRFSLGNSAGNKMLWDGSALSITGSMTATAGSIGGWSVGASTLTGGNTILSSAGDLTIGTGNNLARLSSTDATYRFWVGNATAGSAPFRVTAGGAVTASNLTVTGGAIAGSALNNGEITGAKIAATTITGSNIAGSTITADKLSVSTLSAISANVGTITAGTINAASMTISNLSANSITAGTLTFASGGTFNTTGSLAGTLGGINIANLTITGTLTLGSGGSIVDADGSTWSQSGIVLRGGTGPTADTITATTSGGTNVYSIYGWFSTTANFQVKPNDSSTFYALFTNSSTTGHQLQAGNGSVRVNNTSASIQSASNTGVGTDGTYAIFVDRLGTTQFRIDSSDRVQARGNFFPGTGSAMQSTYYVGSNGSRLDLAGPINLHNHTVAGTAGAIANYVTIQVGGTSYKLALYALS